MRKYGKVLYVDTETTGTNEFIQEPHQISIFIEIDGSLREDHIFYAQPIHWDKVETEALDISGVTMEQLRAYPEAGITYARMINILGRYVNKFDKNDKYVCAGQNVRFDMRMLNQWFQKLGDKYFYSWVNSRVTLDTLQPAQWFQFLETLPDMPNAKLISICEALGVPLECAHDAREDLKATRILVKAFMECMKTISFDQLTKAVASCVSRGDDL